MKHLDFTINNARGIASGLRIKKYQDGEVLARIMFEGFTHMGGPTQDEVMAWLTREQVDQLIETLQED